MMSGIEAQFSQLRKRQKQDAKVEFRNRAQKRLKGIAQKKLTTCFIFALAEFENAFGEKWGHGLDVEDRTEEQVLLGKKWQEVRTRILDKGNTQSRALSAELDLHDIEFVGYRVKFEGVNGNVQE